MSSENTNPQGFNIQVDALEELFVDAFSMKYFTVIAKGESRQAIDEIRMLARRAFRKFGIPKDATDLFEIQAYMHRKAQEDEGETSNE